MKDIFLNIKRAVRMMRVINFNTNTIYGPLCLDIAVTSRCNHKCIFCGAHSCLKKDETKPEELERGVLENLLDDCVSLGVREIVFAGNGEPLLYKGLPDIIIKFGGKLDIRLLTNGSTLGLMTEDVFSRMGKLTISMNSVSSEVHSMVHGYAGKSQYPLVRANIERLLRLPDAQQKIQINYVICKENLSEFPNVLELARQWDTYFAIRPLAQGFPELAGSALSIDDIKSIQKEIAQVKQKPASPRMAATLRQVEGACVIGENKVKNTADLLPCYSGFYWQNIWSNGDYAHCVYTSKGTFGNIKERCFRDIWSDTATQAAIYAAAQMENGGKAMYHACKGCPSPQMQSAAFHRLFKKIPFQLKLLKHHADKYASVYTGK
jgi:MoaA/NifB/PqqE/SkfB family radical SAM enzyme